MGYKSLLRKTVKTTFKAVGDLAIPVTLYKKISTSFNFDTGVAKETEITVASKGIIIASDKMSPLGKTIHKSLILMTEDISDILAFDRVLINNEIWNIGSLIDFDDYIYTIDIYKD